MKRKTRTGTRRAAQPRAGGASPGSGSGSEEDEHVPSCRYRAFTDSVGDMRQWFMRHDIAKLVEEGDGIAQISDFLPEDVAEAALSEMEAIPEGQWHREQSGDSSSKAELGDAEPEVGSDHFFSACDQESAPAISGLARALWVAQPQCMPCFSAVRAHPGRSSALRIFNSKSVLYGAFVWARRALNRPKRRFPARAGALLDGGSRRLPGRSPPNGGDGGRW
jgi:hypothetical protein